MASPLTHAATGLALGTIFWRQGDTKRFWIAGAVCAALADVDAFGVLFGIPYESAAWGHRGFTHSLTFALLLALLVAWKGFDAERRRRMGLYLFIAAASHGLLDAMTTEVEARRLAQDLALAVQAALLYRSAPASVFGAFCASRLGGDWGYSFGTLGAGVDFDALLDRALPA